MVRKAIRTAKSHIDGEGEVNVILENVSKPSNTPITKLEEDFVVEEPENVPLNPVVGKRKGRPRSKMLVSADEVAMRRKSKKGAKKDDTQVYVGDSTYDFGMRASNPQFIVDSNDRMMAMGPQYYPVHPTCSPRFSPMRLMVYNASSSSGGGSMSYTSEPRQRLHPTYSPRFSPLRPVESITSSSSGGGSMSYTSESFQQKPFPNSRNARYYE